MTNQIIENNVNKHPQFENCISLGWFCGTAASMARYGLRSCSGPFDWYFSDLESVLKLIETDFSDFMIKENLEVVSDKPNWFHDKKYEFYCNHDIKNDFEKEYPQIFEKYHKRAIRFMEDIKRPTCFIRAVKFQEEISFIKNNRDYIYKTIRKSNPNNEIIFLLLKDMEKLPDDFLQFKLDIDSYIGEYYEMRTMFDSSKELLKYCQNNILSDKQREINQNFDKKLLGSWGKSNLIMHRIEENNDDIALVFKDYFSDIDKGIYLLGTETYAVSILKYMRKRKIKVNGIIKTDSNKFEKINNNVPIISFSDLKNSDINIFVAIDSKKESEIIINQVYSKYPNSRVLTWNILYGYYMMPSLSWY